MPFPSESGCQFQLPPSVLLVGAIFRRVWLASSDFRSAASISRAAQTRLPVERLFARPVLNSSFICHLFILSIGTATYVSSYAKSVTMDVYYLPRRFIQTLGEIPKHRTDKNGKKKCLIGIVHPDWPPGREGNV